MEFDKFNCQCIRTGDPFSNIKKGNTYSICAIKSRAVPTYTKMRLLVIKLQSEA